jgi:hypothetical protein
LGYELYGAAGEEGMRYFRFLVLGVFAPLFVAGSASAFLFHGGGAAQPTTKVFKATLNGASEVPPNNVTGNGTATATLNTATRQLTWDVTYSGLGSPAKAAGIHGPAEPGKDGPVVIRFHHFASPINGSGILTPPQVTNLEAGKYYVNIQTVKYSTGEIRGQLTLTP